MSEEQRAQLLVWLKANIAGKLKTGETYTDPQKLEALEEVEQYIKNYCTIPHVPNALKYTWANMALDLLRTLFPSDDSGGGSSSGEADITGTVKAIQEGDTKVEFDSDSDGGGGYKHKPDMDSLMYDYLAELRRFRRIY